jgi:hypothetical protein
VGTKRQDGRGANGHADGPAAGGLGDPAAGAGRGGACAGQGCTGRRRPCRACRGSATSTFVRAAPTDPGVTIGRTRGCGIGARGAAARHATRPAPVVCRPSTGSGRLGPPPRAPHVRVRPPPFPPATDPLVVMNADQRVAGTSEHSSARTRRCWPAPASPWPSTTTSLCPSLSFVQADVHAGVCALWVYRPARRTVRVSTGLERR